MISHLSGTLSKLRKDSLYAVVDVSGVGYEVLLPYFVKRTLEEQGEGQQVDLEVYYYATERHPKPILIGFMREHEKSFFERLVGVEDIGPAKAAAALVMSVSTIARAIEDGDVATLKRLPGIGERTASKVVATLRGKMAGWALLKDEGYDSLPSQARTQGLEEIKEDVVLALTGLGYRRSEARARVEEVLDRSPNLKTEEDILREVFRAERPEARLL